MRLVIAITLPPVCRHFLEADDVLVIECGNYTRQIIGQILPDTVLNVVGHDLDLHGGCPVQRLRGTDR